VPVRKVKEPPPTRKVRQVKSAPTTDPVPLPEFDQRFAIIREKTQNIEPLEEWESIKQWMDDEPKSLQEIRTKMKKHADIAQRAKNLYLMAKSELAAFDLRYRERRQLWRVAAIAYWEEQKAAGLRKQITEDMLTDWMIGKHGELYIELEKRHDTLTSVKDQLKSLADRVVAYGQDLRKLLESETRRPLDPRWFDDNDKGGSNVR
jgi:hypothetical protein